MPALGAPELIIILVIIVLIFGVGKLPEVGSALGKGIREFRGAAEDTGDEKKDEPAATTVATVEAPRPAPAVEAPRELAEGATAYTVQDGDTLDSVATRHGLSVDELMRANGYSQRDRVLYAGDRLQLPRATTSSS